MMANGWQVRIPSVALISLAICLLAVGLDITLTPDVNEHIISWMIGAAIGIIGTEVGFAWIEHRHPDGPDKSGGLESGVRR